MNRTVFASLIFLAVFRAAILPAHAQWKNGQNADLVLGQPDFETGNAGTSSTTLTEPQDIAIDPTTGNVFVSDKNNNRVLRFHSLAALTNGAAAVGVLGQPDLDSNGSPVTPTAASMRAPEGIAIDANGTLWVADANGNRVLRFDNASAKADADGANADAVLGQQMFNTLGQGTSNSTMARPNDVAVEANGTLWVVDGGNNRILRFANAAGKDSGSAAEGVLGQSTFNTNASATTDSGLNSPAGVAVEAAGRLWVADIDNNRVLRYDDAANKNSGDPADGVLGQTLFTTTNFGNDADNLFRPFGLGVAPNGDLWVVEFTNSRAVRFANAAAKANGAAADTVIGQTDFGLGAASLARNRFNAPRDIFPVGNTVLLIADANNNRVLRFRDPVIFQIAAKQKKIKVLKKAIKRAQQKKQKAKAKRLKRKLNRFQKQLRTLRQRL